MSAPEVRAETSITDPVPMPSGDQSTLVAAPEVTGLWFAHLVPSHRPTPAVLRERPRPLLFEQARPTPTLAELLATPTQSRHGASHERTPSPDQTPEASPIEREVSVRRALLLARDARRLSPEEDARLQVATARIRKLLPRVTASDFEALEESAEVIAALHARATELRKRIAQRR